MDEEAVTSRPESPKKKIKSNPPNNSEAEPSTYSNSQRNVGHDAVDGNSVPIVNGGAPTRRGRNFSVTPDSSSERSQNKNCTENVTERIQEEEVSSSESFVGKTKKNEPDDLMPVCDSASLDLSSSDPNEKH